MLLRNPEKLSVDVVGRTKEKGMAGVQLRYVRKLHGSMPRAKPRLLRIVQGSWGWPT